MEKFSYEIRVNNNELSLVKEGVKGSLFSSFWFMEFGKICAEVKDKNEKKIYSISKKFQFWKWRMVYLISKNIKENSILISQNTRNTIFKMDLLSGDYEVKVHYKKKKSIYKDNVKIAEFNENNVTENSIQVLVSDLQELEKVFLLYVCLQIGNNDFKSQTVLSSQKKLEKNTEPWF